MRYVGFMLVGMVAVVGCQSEVNSPMAKATNIKPLFAVGSNDEQRVEKFLSRYPPAQAAKFREILANGPARLVSTNPQAQEVIDAIYNALDRQRQAAPHVGVRVMAHQPGPKEEALIVEFLKTVPPNSVAKYRRALYASNAEIRSSNPAVRMVLAAIYKTREEEQRAKHEGSTNNSQ